MPKDDAFNLIEQFRDFTSAMTGMKAQLIENGWSDEGAEQIVIHALKAGNK